MSIWGRKVDAWFDGRTGHTDLDAGEREKNSWRLVAILALVVAVAILAVLAQGR